MNRKPLTKEEVEQINGGLIVDTKDGWFYVVDDHDGYIYNESNINKEFAIYAAGMNQQSKEIISPAEFKKRFGTEFKPRH